LFTWCQRSPWGCSRHPSPTATTSPGAVAPAGGHWSTGAPPLTQPYPTGNPRRVVTP